MFDAIASPKPSARSARSIAVSISIHGIVVGAALLLAYLRAHDGPKQVIEVPLPPYRPAVAAPGPSGNKPPTSRPDRAKPKPAARPVVEPKEIPRPVEPSLRSLDAPVDDTIADGDAAESGIDTEGVIEGTPGGQGRGAIETLGAGPIEFNDAMTPPRKISGPDPRYTREALEREIEGTMVVKCVVTTQGIVRNCRVLKSLPLMDRAVIDALENRRYTPALLRGRPIEVDYTFNLQLKLPQ